MSNFWKTDIGKVLGYGIHEHNGAIGSILNILRNIEQENNTEDMKEYIRDIKTNLNTCKESIDYIYKNIKDLKDGTQNT